MKLIGPPGTELRHILATYILCPCDLHLWPISPKFGSRDPEVLLNVCAYFEVHRRFSFWNIWYKNSDLVSPLLGNRRCRGNHFVFHSLGGLPHVSFRVWLIRPPSTELLQFLTGYVMIRCDLDLWPFDLGVMSRDTTWKVNPFLPSLNMIQVHTTYRSRVRTTTIFHWPPA